MCLRCGAIKQIALFAALSNQESSARRTTRGAAPVHVIENRSKAFGLNVQPLPHGRGAATTTVRERRLNMECCKDQAGVFRGPPEVAIRLWR